LHRLQNQIDWRRIKGYFNAYGTWSAMTIWRRQYVNG
jgi:hypothetical protein